MITINPKCPLLILCLLLISLGGSPAHASNPAAAASYVSAGLQQLSLQTPAGLANADVSFASALASDSSNNQALVLKSLSGLLLIQSSPGFVQFLASAGVTNPALNLYNLGNVSYATPLSQYGNAALTGNLTSVTSYTATTLSPQLAAAITLLSKFSTNASFTLTQQQTGSFPISIDYGDVQLLLCGLHLAQAATYIGDTYNLNILLNDAARLLNGEITLQELLPIYPQLLQFSGNNQRAQACQSFLNANTAFLATYDFIRFRRILNPSFINLFAIETQDPATMASFTSTAVRFNQLAASFNAPQIFPADPLTPTFLDGYTVSLGSWLTSGSSPRSWIGANSFWGDLYNPGTLASTTFSGALPQMTDATLSSLLAKNGLVHRVIAGAGITINSPNRRFIGGQLNQGNQFFTDGILIGGTYRAAEFGVFTETGYSFLWDGTNYTALEYPMAQNTTITGMSNGMVWGSYAKGSIKGGFLYKNGTFTPINFPGSPDTSISLVSSNKVAGTYWSPTNNSGAFLYDGTKYHNLLIPGVKETWTWFSGMNGSTAWGQYYNGDGNYGFLYNGVTTANIAYPGSGYTSISAVLGGKVIGSYSSSNTSGAFLYSNGAYSTFNFPGGTNTSVNSNYGESGNQVTGSYQDINNGQPGNQRGFIYDGTNFTSISYPGDSSTSTSISGGSSNAVWGVFWTYINGGYSQGIFVYRNGTYTKIPVDLGSDRWGQISGVSGSNVVGTYNFDGITNHAFLYNGTTLTTIDFPGAQSTQPFILGSNWMIGNYSSSRNWGAFAYWIGAKPKLTLFEAVTNQLYYPGSTLLLTPPIDQTTGQAAVLRVVSGFARLNDNQLTFTGPGTVVVSASSTGYESNATQTISFNAVSAQSVVTLPPGSAAPIVMAFQADANGKYVSADNAVATRLIANRSGAGQWENYQVSGDIGVNGAGISLKALANNRFVSAENQGKSPLIANRTTVGLWETFSYLNRGGGAFGLLSQANNRFVSADNGGASPLIANRTSVGQWESFQWSYYQSVLPLNVTVSFQCATNGAYVTADNAGNSPLIANRTGMGAWEGFRLVNAGGGHVGIQSLSNNRFVCADNAGNSPLIANRTSVGLWESYDLIDLGNGNVALESLANGKFVTMRNGRLIASQDAPGYGEQFMLNLTLKAQSNGKYVSADNQGTTPLIANRSGIGQGEQYQLVNQGGGNVALKAKANGKYVSADNAGTKPLIANRTAPGQWESFQWINNSDGTVSLKALANGKFVCSDNAGNSPLIPNRSAPGLWEKFR